MDKPSLKLVVLSGLQAGASIDLSLDCNYLIGDTLNDDVVLREASGRRVLLRLQETTEDGSDRVELQVTTVSGPAFAKGQEIQQGQMMRSPVPIWLEVGGVRVGIGAIGTLEEWQAILAAESHAGNIATNEAGPRKAKTYQLWILALVTLLASAAALWTFGMQDAESRQQAKRAAESERKFQALVQQFQGDDWKTLQIAKTSSEKLRISGHVRTQAQEAQIRDAVLQAGFDADIAIQSMEHLAKQLGAAASRAGITGKITVEDGRRLVLELSAFQLGGLQRQLKSWDGNPEAFPELKLVFTDAWNAATGQKLVALMSGKDPADEQSRAALDNLRFAILPERYRRIARLQTSPNPAVILATGERVLVGASLGNGAVLHSVEPDSIKIARSGVIRLHMLR